MALSARTLRGDVLLTHLEGGRAPSARHFRRGLPAAPPGGPHTYHNLVHGTGPQAAAAAAAIARSYITRAPRTPRYTPVHPLACAGRSTSRSRVAPGRPAAASPSPPPGRCSARLAPRRPRATLTCRPWARPASWRTTRCSRACSRSDAPRRAHVPTRWGAARRGEARWSEGVGRRGGASGSRDGGEGAAHRRTRSARLESAVRV